MTLIEIMAQLGFIYKRISKRWALVRMYADERRFLYHFVFPAYLPDKFFVKVCDEPSGETKEERLENCLKELYKKERMG